MSYGQIFENNIKNFFKIQKIVNIILENSFKFTQQEQWLLLYNRNILKMIINVYIYSLI